MPLIASTVFRNGRIHGVIVACTEEEYKEYVMYDKINENQVSVTFLKEYLKQKGFNADDIVKNTQHAPAGNIGHWLLAFTITIPNLKEVLEYVQLDFHTFIDDYCEYLKGL